LQANLFFSFGLSGDLGNGGGETLYCSLFRIIALINIRITVTTYFLNLIPFRSLIFFLTAGIVKDGCYGDISAPLSLAHCKPVPVVPHNFNRLNDCPTKTIRTRDLELHEVASL
jgi:hypothetical protein